jgi:long-chain acyl-CoA synthetase
MIHWPSTVRMRDEVHFSGREVRCFTERPATLRDMFEDTVRRHGDHEAYVCAKDRLSWSEAFLCARRLAAVLQASGVQPGDRIALLLGNGLEFVIAVLASLELGAVAVPLSPRMQTDEIAYALIDSEAKVLFHARELGHRLPLDGITPDLKLRIPLDKETSHLARSEGAIVHRSPSAAQEAPAFILYTSGTTGRPKGAILTHLNLVHSCLHYEGAMALTHEDRSVAAVPLSHVTGLVALMLAMMRCGGTLVIMPRFRADEFIDLAAREKMTHTVMVPAMYSLCLMQPAWKKTAFPDWRIGAYGGAPMPETVIEALAETVPGLCLMNAYGATETSSPVAVMPPGGGPRNSVGAALPCVDVKVVDPGTKQELAIGDQGELWIRGPMVVPGYWKNPITTDECFIDGWWRSGDIASIDQDGFVFIHDRLKDMINRGGYKVFSAEVENALMRHAAVIEAAVVPTPCAVLGERVRAFVTVSDLHVDEFELRGHCGALLSDYKVPETIQVSVDPLPRNANGKIQKLPLRQRAMEMWVARR